MGTGGRPIAFHGRHLAGSTRDWPERRYPRAMLMMALFIAALAAVGVAFYAGRFGHLRAVWGGGTFVAAVLAYELIISMADASTGRAAVPITLLAAVAVLAVPVGAAVLAMNMSPPAPHYPTDQPIHVYRTADKKRSGADCTLSLTAEAMVIDEAGKQKRIAWAWLEPVTCDGECVMLDWDDGRKRRKLSILAAAGKQNPTVRRSAAVALASHIDTMRRR